MAVWSEIGRIALEELGVLPISAPFESKPQERSTLARLKNVIDEFVVLGKIIPGYERYTLTVTAPAKTAYEIGAGRDIAVATVPIRLKDVSYCSTSILDPYPLDEVSFTTYQEQRWPRRVEAQYPWQFYYELGGAFGTLYLNTYPTAGDTLELAWPRFLLPDGSLDPAAEAVVPLGWARFLSLALAVDLLNVYRKDESTKRDLRRKMADSRATIIDTNDTAPRTKVDDMFLSQRRNMTSPMRGSRWR